MAIKVPSADQHAWFHQQHIAQPSCCWCHETSALHTEIEKLQQLYKRAHDIAMNAIQERNEARAELDKAKSSMIEGWSAAEMYQAEIERLNAEIAALKV